MMTPDEFYTKLIERYSARGFSVTDNRGKHTRAEDAPEVEMDNSRRSLLVFPKGFFYIRVRIPQDYYLMVVRGGLTVGTKQVPFKFPIEPFFILCQPVEFGSAGQHPSTVGAITPDQRNGFPIKPCLELLLSESNKVQDFEFSATLRDLRNRLYPR